MEPASINWDEIDKENAKRSAHLPRLLPLKAGAAMLSSAVASSEPGDYFVIALSMDDLPPKHPGPILAEFTHCATFDDAERKVLEYRKMREVSDAFVLSRLMNVFSH